MNTLSAPLDGRRDLEVISLIGLVHGVSHFFHLLLPPLFPWLMAEFGLSFAAIGVTMTVFFVVSGVLRVFGDTEGGEEVLYGLIHAHGMFGELSVIDEHFATGLPMLVAVAALAGLGNSVFHPADFTVLNRHVSPARLGHAFSAHGLSANLGWACAPLLLTTLASAYGWRQAALGAVLVALSGLLALAWRHAAIADPRHGASRATEARASTLDFLRSRPVWLCFLFFLFTAAAFGAIQNFVSPILHAVYGLARPTAALALSVYMLGSAAGVILGGFLAQKNAHDHLIAAALGLAAVLAALLAGQWLPGWSMLPLMAGMGFFTGVAGPSRDLLVRRAATARFGQSAFGRIYGFVYSGLDLGLACAPLLFAGWMDASQFSAVLVGIAVLQALAILTALRVGKAG